MSNEAQFDSPRQEKSATSAAIDAASLEAVRRGVNRLAQAVKVTLGPMGRSVILNESYSSPTVTKDGVTVAKEIELEDVYENMGAQMLREVASKTSDMVGDGTTTAMVIAEAIINEGLRALAARVNPVHMKQGIDRALADITKSLKGMAIKITNKDEMASIGTIAADNDREIGELLAEAIEKLGDDGVITVAEGTSLATNVEWVEGMQLHSGYLSPHFATDSDTQECVLMDPYILLYEKKISKIKDILPLLEAVVQQNKALLIIAEEVDGEVLATLVVNRLRGTLQCAAMKAPGQGDRRWATLEDIAILTGSATVRESPDEKLDSLPLSALGRAQKVIITKDHATIIGGSGKTGEIRFRIETLRREIEDATDNYEREKLRERLAKLSGGVATVNVGAATEREMQAKKARIWAAVHAIRAAVSEGILPGGGVALLRAATSAKPADLTGDQKLGYDIVLRACRSPLMTIAENAGQDGGVVCENVSGQKGYHGYNSVTNQYEDLLAAGIVDPMKVTRTALSNAARIASTLLTSETVLSGFKPSDYETFADNSAENESTRSKSEETGEQTGEPTTTQVMRPILWIHEQGSQEAPLRSGVEYPLKIKMSDRDLASLVAPGEGEFKSGEIPSAGLATQWVVLSRTVQILPSENACVEAYEQDGRLTWYASFDLRIPPRGDSETRQLRIVPIGSPEAVLSVMIYAELSYRHERHARRELIRQFQVLVPIEAQDHANRR